jgi:hypothetical protein
MVSLSLFWHFSMDAAVYLMRKSFAKDCDERGDEGNSQYYIGLEILDP